MILLAFDRETGPVEIQRVGLTAEQLAELSPERRVHSYPYEPVPDFQSEATPKTVLRNAARLVGLPEPWTRPQLEKRFDLRKVSRPEAEAIEAHYFSAAREAGRERVRQRRQRADATRKRLLIRDEDGVTVREMTDAEFEAVAYALDVEDGLD